MKMFQADQTRAAASRDLRPRVATADATQKEALIAEEARIIRRRTLTTIDAARGGHTPIEVILADGHGIGELLMRLQAHVSGRDIRHPELTGLCVRGVSQLAVEILRASFGDFFIDHLHPNRGNRATRVRVASVLNLTRKEN